jgi:hypothetical protein
VLFVFLIGRFLGFGAWLPDAVENRGFLWEAVWFCELLFGGAVIGVFVGFCGDWWGLVCVGGPGVGAGRMRN